MGKLMISCTDEEYDKIQNGGINVINYEGIEFCRVVRCENCKHYEEETWTCLFHGANVRPRDYCSRGEKDEN